jgi:phosphatidylinositol-3-phosphatase
VSEDPPQVRLGPPGDTCRRCASPLAVDQRYCLECGARRAAPRLDFLSLLERRRAALAPSEPEPAPVAEEALADGEEYAADPFPLPAPRSLALAGMAVLMAGVVIGAGLGPPAADTLAAAARQVIVVTGSPAGPPAGNTLAQAEDSGVGSDVAGDVVSAPEPSGGSEDVGAVGAASAEQGAIPLEDAEPLSDLPPVDAGTGDGTGDGGGGGGDTKPSIGHVFALVLAGRGVDATFASAAPAGYLRDELPRRGQVLLTYRAVARGTLANGVALVSGQGPNPQTEADCPTYSDFVPAGEAPDGQLRGEGCVYGAEVKTIADQLSSLGLRWRTYAEGMKTPCRRPAPGAPAETGPYTTAHDPFVFFHSIVDTPDCASSVLPYDRLARDLRQEKTTPTLSWIVPDRCHAGYDGACDGATGAPQATDAFLRRAIPPILRSPAFKHDGLLVVTFDAAPAGAPVDAPVGAVVVSPFVKPGSRNRRPYDHYGLLRTLEERLGLDPLGLAGRRGMRAFGRDVFTRSLAPLAPPEALAATAKEARP